jgi:hypothetical protein
MSAVRVAEVQNCRVVVKIVELKIWLLPKKASERLGGVSVFVGGEVERRAYERLASCSRTLWRFRLSLGEKG